jgi:hypothetical protein
MMIHFGWLVLGLHKLNAAIVSHDAQGGASAPDELRSRVKRYPDVSYP